MDKQEKINKVMQDAEVLLNNLAELKEKVGSYGNAKEELQKTNEKLLEFIEATESLSGETHRVIETLNDIGSGNIFDRLGDIESVYKKAGKKSTIFMIIIGIVLFLQSAGLVFVLKDLIK